MPTSKHALVMTGGLLPGYAADAVWPALAVYFRMAEDKFESQLRARVPVTIREGDDLAKLQALQAGVNAAGAEADLFPAGDTPSVFVLVDNVPRGPVPRGLVADWIERGIWPETIRVANVGDSQWAPFAASAVPMPVQMDAEPTVVVATSLAAATPQPAVSQSLDARAAIPADGDFLPAGAAIHAGFWRRCAAYIVDYFLITLAGFVIGFAIGSGFGQTDILLAPLVGGVPGLIIGWLYFALQESSKTQATLGKRALGIKVANDAGQRISFGRATGRFFGKILSSIIFCVGFMLAGWTERKQALHDMICSTVVIFDSVQPGQPLPTVRPPMPWYGWLVNILLFGLLILGVVAICFAVVAVLSGLTSGKGGF